MAKRSFDTVRIRLSQIYGVGFLSQVKVLCEGKILMAQRFCRCIFLMAGLCTRV